MMVVQPTIYSLSTNEPSNVLLVTVGEPGDLYESGREAIETLRDGGAVREPATPTFADAAQLSEVFNERTVRLLRVIREESPERIRETARLVDRDVKNVHGELTTLEALGVIRFEETGRARRPVFPFEDIYINPLAGKAGDDTGTATT